MSAASKPVTASRTNATEKSANTSATHSKIIVISPVRRTCPICGDQFLPSHHAKKTCSDSCKKEFIRIRDANYRRAAYIADPDINRKRHRRALENASAEPDAMADLLRKRAEARAKTFQNRDADPVRRTGYLRREQIRNAFRTEYRMQRKVVWKALLSERDRETWRRYDAEWQKRKRQQRGGD